MADIRFDTGLKEFTLNGACTVTFCPTDMNFVEKVFNTLNEIDAIQEGIKPKLEASKNEKELFDITQEFDAEIREKLNALFGSDICTPLFGYQNTFSLANGFPVWANLIFAIIDMLDGEFAEEKKKMNPRIKKYTEKYKR